MIEQHYDTAYNSRVSTANVKIMHKQQVEFDPTNPKHREHYYNFIVNNTWSGCPYQFKSEGIGIDKGNIDDMIIQYYLSREFAS